MDGSIEHPRAFAVAFTFAISPGTREKNARVHFIADVRRHIEGGVFDEGGVDDESDERDE